MGRERTKSDRQAWKKKLETLLASSEFVTEQIVPLLREVNGDISRWREFEIVRNKASNRMTVRYAFGPTFEAYGKVYRDAWVGSEAQQAMSYLWEHGFSSNLFLRIPEPLGFISAANLLLMRKAAGVPLDEIAASGRIDEALRGMRLAARWLVKFQTVPIPGLRSESPCERIEVLQLADAVGKVAAEHPEQSSVLIEMFHALRSVVPLRNSSPAAVPMHGQFRPGHIFIEDDRATAIDIEKVCLSDPAKDVARFCHVVKKTCLEQAGNTESADQLAGEFVNEYRKYCHSSLENYPYFRALLAMKAFAKMQNNRKVDESRRKAIGEAHRREFERSVEEASAESRAA